MNATTKRVLIGLAVLGALVVSCCGGGLWFFAGTHEGTATVTAVVWDSRSIATVDSSGALALTGVVQFQIEGVGPVTRWVRLAGSAPLETSAAVVRWNALDAAGRQALAKTCVEQAAKLTVGSKWRCLWMHDDGLGNLSPGIVLLDESGQRLAINDILVIPC